MNEQRIEEIKSALKQLVAMLSQRGKPLSNDLKVKLAQVLEFAANRIQELRGEEEPPPQEPDVPKAPYPSSQINGFQFDPKSGELLVQFHGPYPKAEGPVYSYKGVPSYIFDVFARGAVGPKTSGQNRYHKWIKGVTPSLGGALNALIKAGGFSYQRLS